MSFAWDEPKTMHYKEHLIEATSMVVHRVPPTAHERFLELQRGITLAAESFTGYRRTDVYPPTQDAGNEWVVVVQFENLESLDRWLALPERAEWTKKFNQELGEYRLKTLSAGFGQWFANLGNDTGPPSWKMALTVWLALYPTVMMLTLLIAPHTRPLGVAISILIGNALSVSILQWAVMPLLTKSLRNWLKAPRSAGVWVHLRGAIFILFALAAWTILFRQWTN